MSHMFSELTIRELYGKKAMLESLEKTREALIVSQVERAIKRIITLAKVVGNHKGSTQCVTAFSLDDVYAFYGMIELGYSILNNNENGQDSVIITVHNDIADKSHVILKQVDPEILKRLKERLDQTLGSVELTA